MATITSAVGARLAQAAANKTRQRRRRPAPVAKPTAASRPLPNFLLGGRAGAAPVASFMPKGNAAAEMLRAKMPSTFTADMRSADLDRRFGPIVGPRAQMATVATFQGLDGWFSKISLKKLTNWVGNAAKAVASKDPMSVLSVAAAAVPGGKTPTITAKPPVPVPQPTQVEQFYASMKPQNSTQTAMMIGAGVLGLGLVAMLLRRR